MGRGKLTTISVVVYIIHQLTMNNSILELSFQDPKGLLRISYRLGIPPFIYIDN